MNSQPNDGFEWVQAAGGPALVCVPLRPFADHFFTTRDWALGSPAGGADADWQPVAASLGVDPAHLVRLHQVHGAAVVVRRAGDGRPVQPRPDADIVVSDDASVALAIQTADCVPLLIADRATGVVAAAHAGWRGLAAGVPGVTVVALAHEFGSAPANLIAAVGPSISAERYEVGEDVRAHFLTSGWPGDRLERWFPSVTRPGHWLFDGWESVRDQLLSAGVPGSSIYSAALCTSANPDLFCSYRRDGKGAGRIAAAIRRSAALG
jgi:purine-nucleoside/S-methyl-5'-thioadenosine phosphorylase / adenosine deaminase